MRYGERLELAMTKRAEVMGRKVTRKDLAQAVGCSVQNIGMIISGVNGNDPKLGTVGHAKAVRFLSIDSEWLLDGSGDMFISDKLDASPATAPAAMDGQQKFKLTVEQVQKGVDLLNALCGTDHGEWVFTTGRQAYSDQFGVVINAGKYHYRYGHEIGETAVRLSEDSMRRFLEVLFLRSSSLIDMAKEIRDRKFKALADKLG